MTLAVRLFAQVRELAGTETMTVAVVDGANIAAVRAELAGCIPAAAGLIARSAIGVNGEYAADDCVVRVGDEIALIPPVSGG